MRISPPVVDQAFPAGGKMGEYIRNHNWAATPLGPISRWPQSLKTATALMLESSFAMVVAWGPDFRFLYNDRYLPILGHKHPRSLGAPAREIFPEVWDTIIGPLFLRTRKGEAVAQDDLLIPLHRFGYLENCYFTISYSPIRDESGAVGGMLAVVAETTERVESERRLATLRDLARRGTDAKTPREACVNAARVFAANPIDVPFALLYLLEPDGHSVRLASRSGLDSQPAAAPERIELSSGSGEPTSTWPIRAAMHCEGSLVVEDVLNRFGPLGSGPYAEPVIHALLIPLARPGAGQPYGVLVAGVSARRALNEHYRDFLELAAEHTTTAIANARAFEEERRRADALAEIDRAKTAFFSNVSHEFRTPLTLMLGPLEQALRDAPAQRDLLELAHRNSLRLLKLVNSLLDFSRLEAGRVNASYEAVDLASYTSDLASQFRSAFEKAGLQLVLDCPPLSEPVYIDRDMWEKIVFNLLSNAFKFTFEGQIEVRLREIVGGQVKAENGIPTINSAPRVRLSVRDTGIGIPAAELPRVFERFHRVRNARARSHEGTGIGLALVQELVRLHGGTVEVESTEGAGSTFAITLPFGAAHLPPEQIGAVRQLAPTKAGGAAFVEEALRWLPESETFNEGTEDPASTTLANEPASSAESGNDARAARSATSRRERIVLADDNGDMRNYVRRLLEHAGYEVVAVTDGEAALQAVRTTQPGLVVSDIMMPRRDGLSLLAELRVDPATRTIPVILLSARAGEEARVVGAEAGADDYLTKPFSARELLARVETHLKLARLRHEAAAVVENERKRLRDFFMNAPAVIAVLRGPQHIFELVNPSYVALARRSDASELLGKSVAEALPEALAQGFVDILNRVYRTGEPFVGNEMRLQLVRSDNGRVEEVYLNFVYQPIRQSQAAIDGIFVHAVDVTEQVRARQSVERLAARLAEERDRAQASEQNLRLVVENTPECVKLVAPDGTLLQMNASGLAMIEADCPDLAVGKNVYDVIAPEDRERFRQLNESVCRGEKRTLEFRIVGLRGTSRYLETHAVPLRRSDGSVVQLALTRDITGRKQSEDAIRKLTARAEQERRLYHTILSSTPDLVYVFDLQHRFTYANGALLQMWGRTWDEAIGKTCLELGYEPWHAAMHDREIEHVIATKQSIRGEVPFNGSSGRRIYDYIFVPVIGEKGQVEAIAGTTRDITEMVSARETIAEHRKELEELVSERTAKLAQTIEQMEEFSYSVSHDLRAPIRAMCGYAEAILEDYRNELSPHVFDLLARIQRNGARMDRLIQDLLIYSRISRREIRLEPVSLRRLIEEIIQQYPAMGRDQADIVVPPELPSVLAHEPSLIQAISNLLNNAVKFVAPGTRPRVEILCRTENERVQLTFVDNGIGIKPEYQSRLFSMFERLHPDRNYEGTGIGLAIVRKAIERMGGRVGMESDGASGCRFWIELPQAAQK